MIANNYDGLKINLTFPYHSFNIIMGILNSQVYVMSGEIMNSTLEIIEVLDLDTNTVRTLTGPGCYQFK
jgi:hypothetical protein